MKPSGPFHPIRFIYLGYYLKNLDWAEYMRFLRRTKQATARSKLRLALGSVIDSLTFNVSLLEYFQFNFTGMRSSEKQRWAGSGYMYEYQRVMNSPTTRSILDDKREFYTAYKQFFKHKVFSLEELERDAGKFAMLSDEGSGKIVLKASTGKCGAQVKIIDSENYDCSRLLLEMRQGLYNMAEEYVVQHHNLRMLSPSAVNTVRIITQLNAQNEVRVLGCRLRISIDSPVDNLAAGNIAAPIDEETGVVCGPAVYSEIGTGQERKHPITGTDIVGFQVPYWNECLQLAKSAALHDPSNRSIGWDIVVTESGPGLIEGNHDWCKLVWQLPVETGLRPVLDEYWEEYSSLEKTI